MRSVITAMKLDIEHLATESTTVPMIAKIAPRLSMSVAYLERLLGDMKEYTRAPNHDMATESLANLCGDALRMVQAGMKFSGRDASSIVIECAVSSDLLVRGVAHANGARPAQSDQERPRCVHARRDPIRTRSHSRDGGP